MNCTLVATLQVTGLLFVSGLLEIGGGWFIWQTVRKGWPWWWAVLGSTFLIAYGFTPTLQPLSQFGRLYAVYGGIFIALSYCWGYFIDGMKLDLGDIIGSVVATVAICIILFWPRF